MRWADIDKGSATVFCLRLSLFPCDDKTKSYLPLTELYYWFAIDMAWCWVLTWYLDNVIYRRRRVWFFLLPSYWTGGATAARIENKSETCVVLFSRLAHRKERRTTATLSAKTATSPLSAPWCATPTMAGASNGPSSFGSFPFNESADAHQLDQGPGHQQPQEDLCDGRLQQDAVHRRRPSLLQRAGASSAACFFLVATSFVSAFLC